MNVTFFNGVTGLIAYQEDLNALSHNVANVSTAGYKGTRSTFEDLLYTRMDVNEEPPMTGHGTRVRSLDLLLGQGVVQQTGNPLDFAIVGEGFFAVQRDGQVEYTRSGAFSVSLEGRSKGRLVTRDGAYVLDAKGRPITLEPLDGSGQFDVSSVAEQLGVYQFSNPYALERTSGSSFLETEASGQAKASRPGREELPYTLVQSALENSNVQLADEMSHLIVAQRAYQLSAKVVQTGDELEEIVNNLR